MSNDLDAAARGLAQEAAALIEQMRLEKLSQIKIMHTAPEAAYDDIVALAAQICDVPLSTITLLDDSVQWHKAMVGFPESMRECKRSDTICNVTIRTPDMDTVVYDASEDIRLKSLPVVDGTYDYLKFYAGMPLVLDGQAVGTLCVMDRVPRKLRKDQLEAMDRLRRLVLLLLAAR